MSESAELEKRKTALHVFYSHYFATKGGAKSFRVIKQRLEQDWPDTETGVVSVGEEAENLAERIGKVEENLEALTGQIGELRKMLMTLSQAYYWTPRWQAMERQADAEEKEGRYKTFSDVGDLIEELNR